MSLKIFIVIGLCVGIFLANKSYSYFSKTIVIQYNLPSIKIPSIKLHKVAVIVENDLLVTKNIKKENPQINFQHIDKKLLSSKNLQSKIVTPAIVSMKFEKINISKNRFHRINITESIESDAKNEIKLSFNSEYYITQINDQMITINKNENVLELANIRRNNEDTIQTNQSSTVRSVESIAKNTFKGIVAKKAADQMEVVPAEDLVFYDYPAVNNEANKSITKDMTTQIKKSQEDSKEKIADTSLLVEEEIKVATLQALDPNFNVGITNSLPKAPSLKINEKEENNEPKPNTDNNIVQDDYSNLVASNTTANSDSNKMTTQPDNEIQDSQGKVGVLNIRVNEVKINKESIKPVTNYKISYLDDVRDENLDYGTGKIRIKKTLNSKLSIREANVIDFSQDNYTTRTELVFEKDNIALTIPVINRDSLMEHISPSGYDAHILVELDEKTEDVEISKISNKQSYFKKLYLDEKFTIVDRKDSEYSFILFTGVVPGNRIINYQLAKSKSSRIIFIDENEVFFDSNFFVTEIKDKFTVTQKDILGREDNLVELMQEQLLFLQDDKQSKKININTFQFNNITYPLNTRKYFEIHRDGKSIYLGKDSASKVVIPTEVFISEIITRFKIPNLDSKCIIQFNINKKVKEIIYDGIQEKYNIELDSFALDTDGQIFDTVDVNSSHFFIKGNIHNSGGVVAVKIKYFDNSVDYVKTFCSPKSYLVEQL